jgi:predicted nucleic acid-binding protein
VRAVIDTNVLDSSLLCQGAAHDLLEHLRVDRLTLILRFGMAEVREDIARAAVNFDAINESLFSC